MKQVAVIIPFYKDSVTDYEKIALQQCRRVLSGYDIIGVKPKSLTSYQAAEHVNFTDVISFDDSYFNGLAGYNRLMMSDEFYGRFNGYDYILTYQMDAFIFKDELSYWCDQGYDYIGAPWITKTYHKSPAGLALLAVQRFFARLTGSKSTKYMFENKVGNGGFSLRKVQRFHQLCIAMKPTIKHYLAQSGHLYNEDVFWSFEPARQQQNFNVPDNYTALKFAFEVPLKSAMNATEEQLPFGCHDWDRYADFWRPIFKRYNYHI